MISKRQQLDDLEVIDRFAKNQGEYPVCYTGHNHWYFMWRGEYLRGTQPCDARHLLALRIRELSDASSSE